MKIKYEDGSFVEFKIGSPGTIAIVIGARDKDNSLRLLINSKEVSLQEFSDLIGGIGLQLPPPIKK